MLFDKMIFSLTIFITSLLFIMFFVSNIIPLINLHKKKDRESLSPFECGFDPLSYPRISFSIHFFIICLMFLIFDIEIVLILPSPLTSISLFSIKWMMASLIIFVTLISSVIIEWKEGSMNWA
uniref:NADH-ubiquinone oxidoreductase chain 3 n=1 Tax=Rhinocola aceris TaxID=1889912 RepID=A0A343KN44_9HEMI|nr:NADH dehydrogenase subunit 3 [Rhinocola aceris]